MMYYFALLFKCHELQLLFVSDILQSSLAVYLLLSKCAQKI